MGGKGSPIGAKGAGKGGGVGRSTSFREAELERAMHTQTVATAKLAERIQKLESDMEVLRYLRAGRTVFCCLLSSFAVCCLLSSFSFRRSVYSVCRVACVPLSLSFLPRPLSLSLSLSRLSFSLLFSCRRQSRFESLESSVNGSLAAILSHFDIEPPAVAGRGRGKGPYSASAGKAATRTSSNSEMGVRRAAGGRTSPVGAGGSKGSPRANSHFQLNGPSRVSNSTPRNAGTNL